MREASPQATGEANPQLAVSVVQSVQEARSNDSAWQEVQTGANQQRRGSQNRTTPGKEKPDHIRT